MILSPVGTSSGILPQRRRTGLSGRRQSLGHNLMDRLVEWWPLSEQLSTRLGVHSGLNLTDNATVTGADGVGSLASQFTAANGEFLSRANEAALQTGDIDFTWSAWAYFNTISTPSVIVSKDDASLAREYVVYLTASNEIRFIAFNGTSTVVGSALTSLGGTISTGVWYFCCGFHDAANNQAGIFVNGTTVINATTGAAGSSATALRVGADSRGGSVPYINGRIQRVGFWKRVLTADEITYLYNGGRGRDYPFN